VSASTPDPRPQGRETGVPMRVIIDGYNLAHASTWLGLKGHVRKPAGLRMMMIRILAEYAGRTDDRITVVFDGLPADRQQVIDIGWRAGIEVLFSGHDEDADTLIERMLKVTTGARDTLVVSSDRQVRAAAGRRRAKSCRSGEFFNRMRRTMTEPETPVQTEPAGKFGGLDEADTTVWMRILGLDDETGQQEPAGQDQ